MRKLLVFLVAGIILSLTSLGLVSAVDPVCTTGTGSSEVEVSCPPIECEVQVLEPKTGFWYDPVDIKWTFIGGCDPSTYTLQYQRNTESSIVWHKIDTVDSDDIPMTYSAWSPSEGTYRVRVRMDQGTGIHVSGYSGFFHIDLTPPKVSEAYVSSGPKVDCTSEESCKSYMTQDSKISFGCKDTSGSGVKEKYWKYRVDEGVWSDVFTYPTGGIQFKGDSTHELEYWCIDNVDKESTHKNTIFIVESQAPTISIESIGTPKYPSEEQGYEWFVNQSTKICLDVTDPFPHPVGLESVSCDGVTLDENNCFSFEQDSRHTLSCTAEDKLGNIGYFEKGFIVESQAPNTYIGYDMDLPYYESDGVQWIDTASRVVLTYNDGEIHPSQVASTYYRYQLVDDSYCRGKGQWTPTSKESGDWNTYNGSFGIPKESCHVIEAYSVDNLENEEEVQFDFVFVDKTVPEAEIIVGTPGYDCGPTEAKCLSQYDWEDHDYWDWLVTDVTPITVSCEDNGNHPSGVKDIWYRVILDNNFENPQTDWTPVPGNETPVYLYGESEHLVEFYCVDNVGKKSEPQSVLFKVEGKPFPIELKEKWNLISFPYTLFDNSVENVFSQLGDNLERVWSYEEGGWHVYSPDAPSPELNTLETIKPGYGYWVKVKEDDTLVVSGSLLSPGNNVPPSRPVTQGWNLIGPYGVDDEKTAYCSLFSLVDINILGPRWSALFGFDAVYDKFYPLGIESLVEPGKGYWLEMDVDDSYSPATACWPLP